MTWNSVLRNMNGKHHKPLVRKRAAVVLSVLSVVCAVLFCGGCAEQGKGAEDSAQSAPGESASAEGKETREPAGCDRLRVVTTIFPPYDFVREVAGEQADLQMLLKPGEESHSYEPTPRDIIAIQECDIFIYTGGENDVWVEDILSSMPDEDRLTLRLTDCVETVEEEHVEGMKESGGHGHEEDASDAGHGDEPESVHEIDEHVWTSPVNASEIVGGICSLLCRADPENSGIYQENAAAYQEELSALDGQFRDVVSHAERHVLIFGDRFPFRYFADEYGLDYYAAFPGCAGDTEPSAATMAFLIQKAEEEHVPAVLKMELSNDDIADAIAEAAGTKVRVFYSCHNLSADDFEQGETYLSMMQKNVETLKEVLN